MSKHLHSIYLADSGSSDPNRIPRQICLNIESFKHHHPKFKHTLYNNETGRAFIAENFNADVVLAYDELIPLAYKADLLRYCLLYKLGGIYADLSLYFFKQLVDQENLDKLFVFREVISFAPWIASNSLIYAPKQHPLFQACIDNVVSNTRTKFYGVNALCPTGPNLFGKNIAIHAPLESIRCGETLRINKNASSNSYAYVSIMGDLVAVNVKNGNGLASLGAKESNDYNIFYSKRNVYRSQRNSFVQVFINCWKKITGDLTIK